MEALLAAGAKTDWRNAMGQTPLHLAAARSDLSACRLLLRAGARHLPESRSGRWCPLHVSAFHGRTATVELLAAQADVNVPAESTCRLLVENVGFFEIPRGATALDLARVRMHTDMIRALERLGARSSGVEVKLVPTR